MTDNERDDARLIEINDRLSCGEDLPVAEAYWLFFALLRTRSELDYARGRIDAYQKVEEWMNQQ